MAAAVRLESLTYIVGVALELPALQRRASQIEQGYFRFGPTRGSQPGPRLAAAQNGQENGGKIDKTFLIAKPMRKVDWTRRFAAGWGRRGRANADRLGLSGPSISLGPRK